MAEWHNCLFNESDSIHPVLLLLLLLLLTLLLLALQRPLNANFLKTQHPENHKTKSTKQLNIWFSPPPPPHPPKKKKKKYYSPKRTQKKKN